MSIGTSSWKCGGCGCHPINSTTESLAQKSKHLGLRSISVFWAQRTPRKTLLKICSKNMFQIISTKIPWIFTKIVSQCFLVDPFRQIYSALGAQSPKTCTTNKSLSLGRIPPSHYYGALFLNGCVFCIHNIKRETTVDIAFKYVVKIRRPGMNCIVLILEPKLSLCVNFGQWR